MRNRGFIYSLKYSWIEEAAFLPAPIAKITVAAPVTASPPAQTPSLVVFRLSSTIRQPFLLASMPLVVCLITNHAQSEKSRALIEYRLDELTKAVQKHNNLVDRTYELEKTTALHTEQINSISHRVEELEKVG